MPKKESPKKQAKKIKNIENTDEQEKNFLFDDELQAENQTKEKGTLEKVFIVIAIILILACAVFIAVFLKNKFGISSTAEQASESFSLTKTIRINEYMISNSETLTDEDWNSPDWIEIFNYGKNPVWLGDVYISDSLSNPEKFELPKIDIQPGEYLLVLASGKEKTDGEYIHAPFKLSEDDEIILLFCDNQIISQVYIENLPQDISAGYTENGGFAYFSEPTPGRANDTEPSSSLEVEKVNSYSGTLVISEYLANNDYGITDASGEHSDWIEIYNPNEESVFLGDYYLSDDPYNFNKYKLPDTDLAAHEYILVFAVGTQGIISSELYAPFAISLDDSRIVVSYKNGQAADGIDVYDMPPDVSVGIDSEGNVGFFSTPTPGYENSTEISYSLELLPEYESDSPLLLNEWMSNNEFGILDNDGDASDWVEIYNPTNETITLEGYALTDDINEPKKWIFPSGVSIEPYSYIVVYLSGKDKMENGEMHASFQLSEEDVLYFTAPNAGIIDSAAMEYLPGNVSKGRTEDGYGYFSYPTPGAANTSSYTTELKEGITFLHGDLFISEVASGQINASRSQGEYTYEYIELYNSGDEKINLKGYSLAEEGGESFVFSDVTIAAKGYLVVSVKGYIDKNSGYVKGENISLDSSGETLLLISSSGITIDCFDTGYLLGDYSSGRNENNADERVFFKIKTPGAKNSTGYDGYTKKPAFSQCGGMKTDEIYLTIESEEGAVIYYSLDGSYPEEGGSASYLYTQPLMIDGDSVVRAVAYKPGRLPSLCTTNTFIFERTHDIPVICLTTDPEGFFSSARGIYADGYKHDVGPYPYFSSNYYWNVEREVSFEYYNADGTLGVAFDGGIQIAGAYSRALQQKSLVVRLRDEYGLGEVDFPFFDTGTTVFKHLLLRNSGQDYFMTKMRDAYILNCANDLGTVDTKRGTPVAVYINGEYWGFYNMRDKLNSDYFAIKYGYDDDVVINYLTQYSSPKSGSSDDWLELREFCYSHDFNIEENYEKLGEWVDIDAFIDYWIVQMVFSNRDSHNIDFWKADVEGAQWRPVLFDMDLALLPNDVNLPALHFGNGNLGYHDHVKDALVSSKFFKEEFLDRLSYVLTNIYTEEYLVSNLEEYKDLIDEEIKYHIERWPYPSSYEAWENYVKAMEEQIILRRYELPLEIQEFFNLTDEETKELFPWYDEN